MSSESSNSALVKLFSKRRVLVTGGGGFIGSHLVRRIVALGSNAVSLGGNRDDVVLVAGADYIFGDISRDTLETVDFAPQTIFHLAGGASVTASVEDPPSDFLKTVFSTVLLLDFLRRHWPEAQLVYASRAQLFTVKPRTRRPATIWPAYLSLLMVCTSGKWSYSYLITRACIKPDQ